MSADPRLVLRRPREPGEVVRDAIRLYARNFWTMLALAAAIVIPVELAVSGLGLERLFAEYDGTPPLGHQLVDVASTFLVIAPLLVATTASALVAEERGDLKGPAGPLVAGLETFAPLFGAVLLAAVAIAAGFLALIVPGLYLLIRLYFVSQAVVLEERRGMDALARSWELVGGAWWRTLAMVLIFQLAAAVPGLLLTAPFEAGARASDTAALALAGNVVALVLVGPFVAIAATLVYFHLRARKDDVPQAEPEEEPEPTPELERPEAPVGRRD